MSWLGGLVSAVAWVVWRVRRWLLLVALLGFGAAEVVFAVGGEDRLIILFGVLAALSGILLFIFA